MPRGAGPDAAPARRRPAFIVFILIWLATLTGGVIFVGRALLSGPDEGAGAIILWLVVAGGAWFLGVWLLIRALTGRPLRRRRAEGPAATPMRRESGPGESDRDLD